MPQAVSADLPSAIHHKINDHSYPVEMLSALLELFFPSSCLGCGHTQIENPKTMFCSDCLEMVEPLSSPLCSCCGKQFPKGTGKDRYCDLCLTNNYHFDLARALFRYQPPITRIISLFKYQHQTIALKSFRTIFKKTQCCKDIAQPDLIIPVPLHVSRLRQRGFNQALTLARIFYPEHCHLIDFKTLKRTRHTSPQTGMNGKERRRNLKNAFIVTEERSVLRKSVLLIDDVFTTGSTVNECARVLKRSGAEEVQVLTLARVD